MSAHVAGLMSAPDEEHLRFATSTGRTLFTFNTRDFARLHTEWLSANGHHAGIVVSDQVRIGQLIRRLLRLLDGLSAADMVDRLEFLGNWK